MKTRLGRRKGVGGETRLQPEGFQYTTRDRLSSPNWLCHVAVGKRRSKAAVVRVKGKPPTRLFLARTRSNESPSWLDKTQHACGFHLLFAVTSTRGPYSHQPSEQAHLFLIKCTLSLACMINGFS